MKKWALLVCSALLVVGCSNNPSNMTADSYNQVEVGMSEQDLTQKYGSPNEVMDNGPTQKVYVYLEKIRLGNKVFEERKYCFLISRSTVIGKYMRYSNPPPYYNRYSNPPPCNSY